MLFRSWSRKIVLIDAKPSEFRMAGDAVCPMQELAVSEKRERVLSSLLSKVNCYIVTLPFTRISECEKPFRYVPLIVDYIRSVIDIIVVKCDRNAIDRLSLDCSKSISMMIEKTNEYKAILKEKYGKSLNEKKWIESCDACTELALRGDIDASSQSHNIYQNAIKEGAEVVQRRIWARRLSYAGDTWARNELFDLLWKSGNPDDYPEMIETISKQAKTGDRGSIGRLARAYRDGKGVEQNLELSAELMKKAADKNLSWAKWEYFDILRKINTSESLQKMIDYGEKESAGNPEITARMARAYRDGKGVEKDLVKAAELMRAASLAPTPRWAKNELFDILWKISTLEAYGEMILVARNQAATGDGGAMGRLGRAYRDGKGVEKDLVKAAEWMRKAAAKKVTWAQKELSAIENMVK